MTTEDKKRLKELGWVAVSDVLPPKGKWLDVCLVRGRGDQSIWTQKFRGGSDLGFTHYHVKKIQDDKFYKRLGYKI